MSSGEIVNAYVQGEMNRRTMIRRLVAAGVSLGAAVSYAHLLKPGRASAHEIGDHHQNPPAPFTADIVEQRLRRIIRNRFIKVRVNSTGHRTINLYLHLYRPKSPWPDAIIGYSSVHLGPGKTIVKVPLNYNGVHSVNALRRRKRARIGVATSDGDVAAAQALDVAVLRR